MPLSFFIEVIINVFIIQDFDFSAMPDISTRLYFIFTKNPAIIILKSLYFGSSIVSRVKLPKPSVSDPVVNLTIIFNQNNFLLLPVIIAFINPLQLQLCKFGGANQTARYLPVHNLLQLQQGLVLVLS